MHNISLIALHPFCCFSSLRRVPAVLTSTRQRHVTQTKIFYRLLWEKYANACSFSCFKSDESKKKGFRPVFSYSLSFPLKAFNAEEKGPIRPLFCFRVNCWMKRMDFPNFRSDVPIQNGTILNIWVEKWLNESKIILGENINEKRPTSAIHTAVIKRANCCRSVFGSLVSYTCIKTEVKSIFMCFLMSHCCWKHKHSFRIMDEGVCCPYLFICMETSSFCLRRINSKNLSPFACSVRNLVPEILITKSEVSIICPVRCDYILRFVGPMRQTSSILRLFCTYVLLRRVSLDWHFLLCFLLPFALKD